MMVLVVSSAFLFRFSCSLAKVVSALLLFSWERVLYLVGVLALVFRFVRLFCCAVLWRLRSFCMAKALFLFALKRVQCAVVVSSVVCMSVGASCPARVSSGYV